MATIRFAKMKTFCNTRYYKAHLYMPMGFKLVQSLESSLAVSIAFTIY